MVCLCKDGYYFAHQGMHYFPDRNNGKILNGFKVVLHSRTFKLCLGSTTDKQALKTVSHIIVVSNRGCQSGCMDNQINFKNGWITRLSRQQLMRQTLPGGPLLFSIPNNDPQKATEYAPIKSADDPNWMAFGRYASGSGCQSDGPDKLKEWSNTKCKILKDDKGKDLQLGKENPLHHYRLGMVCVGSSSAGKDLSWQTMS